MGIIGLLMNILKRVHGYLHIPIGREYETEVEEIKNVYINILKN